MSQLEKEQFRRYIERVAPYINFAGVCKELDINYVNFKKFKRGIDNYVSLEKLQRIENFIKNDFEK